LDYFIGGSYNNGGSNDILVMRIDSVGNVKKQWRWGGPGYDIARDIIVSPNGMYVIGESDSPGNNGGKDIVLLKIDNQDDLVWAKAYGGVNSEATQLMGSSVVQQANGDLIFGGTTSSYGGTEDLYLLRTDSDGNIANACNIVDLSITTLPTDLQPFTYNPNQMNYGLKTNINIVQNSAGGQSNQICATFSVFPASAEICNGGSVLLTASPGYTTYNWTPNSSLTPTSGAIVTASPTITTTYTVDASGPGGSASAIVVLTIKNSTSSTITVAACNSYTLNAQTYTASGTYRDIIQNVTGCDSIITLNLTINNSFNTLNKIACNSYTSPSSKYTWTGNGTYNDTIPNAVGCDSVITSNLTINTDKDTTLTIASCNSYSLNGQTYDSTGVYTQSLTTSLGCDSTLTLKLNIKKSTSSTLNKNSCGAYTINGQTYNTSGTFNQILVNKAGCDSIITLNLTISNLTVSISSFSNPTCTYSSNGFAKAAANGGIGTCSFLWNAGSQNADSAIGLSGGINYIVSVTDSIGCIAKDSIKLNSPSSIILSAKGDSICLNKSATLTASASGGSSPYNFNWICVTNSAFSPSPSSGSAVNTPNITQPNANLTYNVTVTDNKACTATNSAIVRAGNPLTVNLTSSLTRSLCLGDSTILNTTASGGVPYGKSTSYTYNWSANTGANGNSTVTVYPTAPSTYTVTVTGVACANDLSKRITVDVLHLPGGNIRTTTGHCSPSIDTLSTDSLNVDYQYNWNITGKDGFSKTFNNSQAIAFLDFKNALSDSGDFDATLQISLIKNGATCNGAINGSVKLYSYPSPLVQIANENVNLTTLNHVGSYSAITDSNQTFGIILPENYRWKLYADPFLQDSIGFAVGKYANYNFAQIGVYYILLQTKNNNGCLASDTISQKVIEETLSWIPNAFTPNGDGINDTFGPKGVFIREFEMSIFDKWGEPIFTTNNLNKLWDGTVGNGENASQNDIYVYRIKIKGYGSEEWKSYIGKVVLVK
jgi:gliding motility-associated-like protein